MLSFQLDYPDTTEELLRAAITALRRDCLSLSPGISSARYVPGRIIHRCSSYGRASGGALLDEMGHLVGIWELLLSADEGIHSAGEVFDRDGVEIVDSTYEKFGFTLDSPMLKRLIMDLVAEVTKDGWKALIA